MKIGPAMQSMRDALHAFVAFAFAEVPEAAKVLCVGVGSGAELLYLAEAFPGWVLTGVDPDGAALDACRAHVAERGLEDRCELVQGSVQSLPEIEAFDAATSILVSHYLPDRAAQTQFFSEIAHRLRPGASFVTVELAADRARPTFARVFEIWKQAMRTTDLSPDLIERRLSGLQQTLRSPAEVESILESSGMSQPAQFFQAACIVGWVARRSPTR